MSRRSDRHAATQARAVWPPSVGLFRLRLTKGGWPVPCVIARTEQGAWYATIDGFTHPAHDDPAQAEGVSDVWTYGQIVTRAEYEWALAMKDHAAAHDPDHPCLNPRRAIERLWLRPLSTQGHTTPWTPT